MTEPLVCKWPDCDSTRVAGQDFCLAHEVEARRDAVRAVREAEQWSSLGAEFESWCEEQGQPHPYH